MTIKDLTWRPATPKDAPALVDFVLMAGEGLPDMIWAEMAAPGQTVREVGLGRAAREEGSFSYLNATIFETGGQPVGGLVGYALPPQPVEIGPDFPPAFVPLQELENLASRTWYVNILGVYPEWRGQGVGAAMLKRAEELSRETGCDGLSIIVLSVNPGAERLYRRTGYAERARRQVPMSGWKHDGCEAILLVKT